MTIVVTEGFGDLPMAKRTFDVLSSGAGRRASMSGRTQIRAGVIRPEIVVPLEGRTGAAAARAEEGGALTVGSRVRAVREPHFGRTGKIAALPEERVRLETEAEARVAEVVFDDGEKAVLPVCNIERM